MCKEIWVPYWKISDFARWFLIGKLTTYRNMHFSMIFHVFMRNSQFSNKKMLCVRKIAFLLGKEAIFRDDSLFGNWSCTEMCIFPIRSVTFKLSSCFKDGVDVFSYHVQYNSNHHEIRGVIESIRWWRSRCQLGENQPPAAMIG